MSPELLDPERFGASDIGKTNGRFWRILGIMMDFGHHEAGNFISDVLT